MKVRKLFKWAKGSDAIMLLEKEGGINVMNLKVNENELYYMPYNGGLIDISQHEVLSQCILESGERLGKSNGGEVLSEEKKEYSNLRICKHCGREYSIIESEAEDKENYCCVACEWGF